MARKKILWLCSWYPSKIDPFNGDFIQRHARAAAMYNDIYVLYGDGDSAGKITETEEAIIQSNGLNEHVFLFKKDKNLKGKILSNFTWFLFFRRAIRKYINENGIPELVHVHVPIKAGLIALWLKWKYAVPFVITEHWGIYNDIEINNYKSKSTFFKILTKKVFKNAESFLTVSGYLAESVNKLVVKKEYKVIPNVVDTNKFNYVTKKNSAFRFIHVSNMVPLKNVEGILKAFKKLLLKNDQAELVLVGNANNNIGKYADKLLIPHNNIICKGEVSYEKVAIEMQQADCFILFSNIENSPCVISEALCCGLPVITTNVGGIPELVDDSNAIMVDPQDEKALATAMQEMITNYAIYNRKEIAEKAAGRFSFPVVGKNIDAIYSTVIE